MLKVKFFWFMNQKIKPVTFIDFGLLFKLAFLVLVFSFTHTVLAAVYIGPTGVVYSDFNEVGLAPNGFKDIFVRCPEGGVGGVNSMKDGTILGGAHGCGNFEHFWLQDNMAVNGNNGDEQIADGHYCIHINGGDSAACTHGEFDVVNGLLVVEDLCTVDCFSNVLFLPGIESSRLYDDDDNQLWEPNRNQDVEKLYLNEDGTSINPDIYTGDIIKETSFGGLNIYESFSNTMNQLVADQKITEWKPFAYDWRQGVEEVISNPQKYSNGVTVSLMETLQSLVDSSKNGKVTIVAHSNGGLIAKALLKKLQDEAVSGGDNLIDHIDVLILVAVPEIGTAEAVPAILHGYNQKILGGLLMNETNARELGRNMKGAYGLLPSREYINRVSASPATFADTVVPSGVTTNLINTFGSAIDSYSEYKNFLFGVEGRADPLPAETNLPVSLSQSLFEEAETLHNNIDNWVPPENLHLIEIAGWGLPTVASFEYYPKTKTCPPGVVTCPPYALDERPRFTSAGDGTVVVPSAQYMSLGGGEKYWVNLFSYNEDTDNKNQHKDILVVSPVLNFISNTLQDTDTNNSVYLTTIAPVDNYGRFQISIHSPVTMHAYDADGNHTGKICSLESDFCEVEENISNSSYLEFGEGKYINLPEEEFDKVELKGTGTGTFTYESEKVEPGGTKTLTVFKDIPVTPETKGEVTINTAGGLQLALDKNGDGTTDVNIVAPEGQTVTMPYVFSGFMQPIDDPNYYPGQTPSVFKAGSTIPVKFQLKKYDGTIVQATSVPVWLSPQRQNKMNSVVDEPVYNLPGTNGNTYKWDPTSQQYIYNWSTKGLTAGYWYKIYAKLDDGNTLSVLIGLK